MDEQQIFELLLRRYVQRADARQLSTGLLYMEAEIHDLAKFIAALMLVSQPKTTHDGK